MQLQASAFEGYGSSRGEAQINETVLITGGNGTGYLNIAFDYGGTGYGGSQVEVNGTYLQKQYQEIEWAVVPFTFGTPFSYGIDVLATSDSSDSGSLFTLNFTGAHVYSSEPTECMSDTGICADPGYVDISRVLGAPPSSVATADAPEPNTIALMLGPALFLLWHRLSRRRTNPDFVV
jgi:hypothetical protein